MKTLKIKKVVLFGLATALLNTGCSTNTAGNYRPIVDGPKNAQYKSDLAACQQLSTKRSYMNDDVKVAAGVGAVLGAIYVALDDDDDDVPAGVGAVAGAGAAAGERAWETRDERKSIIIECMKNRGHRVAG